MVRGKEEEVKLRMTTEMSMTRRKRLRKMLWRKKKRVKVVKKKQLSMT